VPGGAALPAACCSMPKSSVPISTGASIPVTAKTDCSLARQTVHRSWMCDRPVVVPPYHLWHIMSSARVVFDQDGAFFLFYSAAVAPHLCTHLAMSYYLCLFHYPVQVSVASLPQKNLNSQSLVPSSTRLL
jgi:hypothetical protein